MMLGQYAIATALMTLEWRTLGLDPALPDLLGTCLKKKLRSAMQRAT